MHHEPTFNRDEIHRHVTVLALTPTRLLVGHPTTTTVTHPARHLRGRIHRVGPARQDRHGGPDPVVPQPETYLSGSERIDETWLTVGWGTMRRLDLEQASCEDPDCEPTTATRARWSATTSPSG